MAELIAAAAAAGEPLSLEWLHKIPSSTSEQTLDRLLQTLWSTRKTGLGSTLKPEVQTLIALPNPQHLDPVLACLRLIIRKCVGGDDVEKLLQSVVDLDAGSRANLVNVIQKYQVRWRDEASKDQPLWQRTRVSNQIKVNALPTITSFPASGLLSSRWSQQGDASYCNSTNSIGPGLPDVASVPIHQDRHSVENMENIPRLKSMTWKMENRSQSLSNRVAVITLKLQDYTKSPSGEIEVKFQLSKDTLDAMLRSMTSISEQLANNVASHLEPLSKKQKP